MSALVMDPALLPAVAKTAFDRVAAKRHAQGAAFGGPYVALFNHPSLAEKVEALGYYLKFEGVLPREVYQFIVLSVSHATGAAFEWHDHVEAARTAGLSQTLIDGIAGGSRTDLPEPYGLLRDIVAAAMMWQPLPDALQSAAVAQWGREGLVEIVTVSGFYQMFAAINQGFNIQPPEANATPRR